MGSAYTLDVPADAHLRCASIGGETIFLLATCETAEGLACRLTAFDLVDGRTRASLVLPYIKHDNGGGSLTAAPTGDRVAVGSEFSIVVHDVDGDGFRQRARLETEQSVCTAKFLGPNRTIHWSIAGFVSTDLQSGEQQLGPELEQRHGGLDRFAIESDAGHLLAIGETVRRPGGVYTELCRVRIRDLDVVDIYEIDGYVVPDPVFDTRGRAYLVSDGRLFALDIASGECRVLYQGLRHATLSGYATCIRLESDTLDLVTRDAWLVFAASDGLLERVQSFPRPVVAAGFDARGRLWTFDAGQVLTQVEPSATTQHT
jgi:hypothetical protein